MDLHFSIATRQDAERAAAICVAISGAWGEDSPVAAAAAPLLMNVEPRRRGRPPKIDTPPPQQDAAALYAVLAGSAEPEPAILTAEPEPVILTAEPEPVSAPIDPGADMDMLRLRVRDAVVERGALWLRTNILQKYGIDRLSKMTDDQVRAEAAVLGVPT